MKQWGLWEKEHYPVCWLHPEYLGVELELLLRGVLSDVFLAATGLSLGLFLIPFRPVGLLSLLASTSCLFPF